MGAFSKWLLHDDQKELFEYLYANVLNIVFLALIALLLWPLGRVMMAFRLAKGYWLFWIVLLVTAAVLVLFRRIFRVDMDSHFDAYVISALVVSCFLQAGWSAFVALTVHSFVASAPAWMVAILYAVGVLSCYVAFAVVSAFYPGSLYRLVNLALAAVSFIVFSVWPAAGRAIYGWFFDLF
ncbi:MAG: hypothetical protein ACRD68_16755 [Pyrinomonadaceae bacterium]